MAILNAQFLDLMDWWFDELRVILLGFFQKQRQTSSSNWTITIADDGIRVHAANAPEFQSIPLSLDATSDEIAARFQHERRAKQLKFDILIDVSMLLSRRLAPRRLPSRQARGMAELDLLASTPIDPLNVYLLFPASPHKDCSYHVAKKKTVESALAAIRFASGTIHSLAIVEQGQAVPVDRLSLAAIWPPTKRERFARRIWAVAVATVFFGIIATYAHAKWRYWQAASALDEQIEQAQMQAKKARALLQKRQIEIQQTEHIRNERKKTVSTVHVLAELTRLLPDSAWLSDFSSKNGELTITGFAASAADLIQPIDASPLFSSPEFKAPVVKVPGQTGERFTITTKIVVP